MAITALGKIGRRAGKATRGKKATPKAKLSDLGFPYQAEKNPVKVKPPLAASTPATVGGRKSGPPGAQRGNSVAVPESRVPMKSAGRSVTPSPTRGGTNEKFMGNMPYEKVQPARSVPPKLTGGGGGKAPPPGDVTPMTGKSKGYRRGAATGAILAAAVGVSSDSPRPRQTGSSATQTPTKEASPVQASSAARGGSQSTATGGGTQKLPAGSSGGSSRTSGATSRPSRAMHGKELADYLGLGADSAVRTYMETGKHKYEPKYPTPTGQKAGTVTKAAQRKQRTR